MISTCMPSIPSSISENDNVHHTDKQNGAKQTDKQYLPPLLNLVRTSASTLHRENENWLSIELKNVNDMLADLSDTSFIMVDMKPSDLYIAVYYDGLLNVPEYIYDIVGDCIQRRVYLIIRSMTLNSMRLKTKPVVSLVKVLERCSGGKLKIVFLTASKPQYVGVPWTEEEIFTSGQYLDADDVRIIMGEYMLSLRHKKIKPLFDDVYVSYAFSFNSITCFEKTFL